MVAGVEVIVLVVVVVLVQAAGLVIQAVAGFYLAASAMHTETTTHMVITETAQIDNANLKTLSALKKPKLHKRVAKLF